MDMRLFSFAHTILYSLKLEQLSDTRYIQLKGNPDRFFVTHKDSWNKK